MEWRLFEPGDRIVLSLILRLKSGRVPALARPGLVRRTRVKVRGEASGWLRLERELDMAVIRRSLEKALLQLLVGVVGRKLLDIQGWPFTVLGLLVSELKPLLAQLLTLLAFRKFGLCTSTFFFWVESD